MLPFITINFVYLAMQFHQGSYHISYSSFGWYLTIYMVYLSVALDIYK